MPVEWLASTDWLVKITFYLGLFDAVAVLLGGLVLAIVILAGWDARFMLDRVIPACVVLILSNLAAAIVLWATKFLT
jgi:hypothetical protein